MGNTDLIVQATDTINKHSMLKGGETVLVGLSGGPDSVCLLTILHRLKEAFNLATPGRALLRKQRGNRLRVARIGDGQLEDRRSSIAFRAVVARTIEGDVTVVHHLV
mgnify:CR=1 FL=1